MFVKWNFTVIRNGIIDKQKKNKAKGTSGGDRYTLCQVVIECYWIFDKLICNFNEDFINTKQILNMEMK